MKFRVWEIIFLSSLIVLAIIFSSLNSLWNGFIYFNLLIIITFIGFFVNNRIFFIQFVKKEYDEGLNTYLAELYNNNMITKEQFDSRDERIINGYYKAFNKLKVINIFLIAGLFFFAITIILVQFNIW